MNVSVLGPPGCGKGTQAKLLAAHFGLKHFSLGETLRAEIEHGSDLGKRTAAFVREGKLVPDQLVEEIFESFVKKNPGKGFVSGWLSANSGAGGRVGANPEILRSADV